MRLAIFDDTFLNILSDLNHACTVYTTDGIPDKETNGNDLDPKLNRRAKLYCTLSRRNRKRSNVRHLDSDDVGLILLSDMIVSVQLYSKCHLDDEEFEKKENDVEPLISCMSS